MLFRSHDAVSGEVLATLAAPAFSQARRVVGAVESRERPEIRGWVLDPSNPERTRRVALHVDGHLCEVMVADGQRGDIARSKGTGGRHGFLWHMPEGLATTKGTRIEVFDADTGRPLRGSPLRIEHGRVVACTGRTR